MEGRTEDKNRKGRRSRYRLFGYVCVMILLFGLLGTRAAAAVGFRYAADTGGTLDEGGAEVFYEGRVIVGSYANVRTGPGTSAEILNVDGENIRLTNGDMVIILGETTNTSNEVWYHIRFTVNGTQVEGYCRSDFITRTEVTITPTPTPSPTPTPEPETEPASEGTSEPAPTQAPEQDGGGSNLTKVLLIVFLILFVLAAAYIAYYFLIYKRQKDNQRMKQKQAGGTIARKRTPGENGSPNHTTLKQGSGGGPGRTTGQPRPAGSTSKPAGTRPSGTQRKPSGTVPARPGQGSAKSGASGSTRPAGQSPAGSSQSRQGSAPSRTAPKQPVKKEANVSQESADTTRDLFTPVPRQDSFATDDRTALREEINHLEAGDYVMHKYLGIGQVYDNSDVKLIEIRFGSDMRFLNKESCIMKRILRKCREDEL